MVLLSNTHTLLFSHRPDLTHTKVIGNIVCNSNYRLPRYLIWLNVPAGAREVRAINAFTSAGPVATVKTSDTQAERQSPEHHQKSNRHEFKRPPPPKKENLKEGPTHYLGKKPEQGEGQPSTPHCYFVAYSFCNIGYIVATVA